jgi:hypothetical protein
MVMIKIRLVVPTLSDDVRNWLRRKISYDQLQVNAEFVILKAVFMKNTVFRT